MTTLKPKPAPEETTAARPLIHTFDVFGANMYYYAKALKSGEPTLSQMTREKLLAIADTPEWFDSPCARAVRAVFHTARTETEK